MVDEHVSWFASPTTRLERAISLSISRRKNAIVDAAARDKALILLRKL